MELGGDPAREQMAIKGRFPGQNRLYKNLGGFRFEDVTDEVHLGQITADTFSSVFADFTGDGWADLYVAVDHREDVFFENTGGSFRQASEEYGVGHVGNDMGIAVADLGSNGTLDLYVTNITDPNDQFGTGSGNTLLVGEPAADGSVTYSDEAAAMACRGLRLGLGDRVHRHEPRRTARSLRRPGHAGVHRPAEPELRNQRARLFLGESDGAFEQATDTGCDIPGDQRSVVPFDYDRDGAPDLLVTQMAYSTVLLENGTSDRHWLTVDLSRAGAQAAGARVTVNAGGEPSTQVALFGGSYLAGMPMELYFGLGGASTAEDVTVTWADAHDIRARSRPGRPGDPRHARGHRTDDRDATAQDPGRADRRSSASLIALLAANLVVRMARAEAPAHWRPFLLATPSDARSGPTVAIGSAEDRAELDELVARQAGRRASRIRSSTGRPVPLRSAGMRSS